MSSPQPGSPPARPLRVAGLALVAVAAVALVAGLISIIIDGEDDNGTAQPPGATTTVTTPQDPGQQPSSGTEPAPPAATTTTAAPPPGQPSPPAPPPPPAPTSAGPPTGPTAHPVRVYNNSFIEGLAAKAGDDIRSAGWNVVETSNYNGGNIPTSTVYYRPGTDEEAGAKALGNRFDLRIEPRFDGIRDASPGLIVIVTNDYGGKSP